MHLLNILCENLPEDKVFLKIAITRVMNFYSSLREDINQFWEGVKKEKIREMQ